MRIPIAVSISFLIAAGAFGQNSRSFVSVFGSDAANCTAILQCRSFNRALSVTNPGGEVIATSSGGYASFFVGQAVTITAAPGAYVEISDGINIAPGANDRVVIKGMHVALSGTNGVGIFALAYGSLFIEDCSVTGGANGIWITGSNSPAILSDTVVRNFSSTGFQITGHATLLRCRAERGQFSTGLLVGSGNVDTVVSAIDFVAAGNEIGAAAINTIAGHSVEMNLDHAVLSDNSEDGVEAVALNGGSTTVRLTNSTVTSNGAYGLNQSGTATLASMNNNFVVGNRTADTVGMISPITAH
jgi:hypothetical protein